MEATEKSQAARNEALAAILHYMDHTLLHHNRQGDVIPPESTFLREEGVLSCHHRGERQSYVNHSVQ